MTKSWNIYGIINIYFILLVIFNFSLAILVGAAQPSDLSITKVASNGTAIIQEVTPGQTFYYIVTVTNPLGTAAPEVIVTDKLPYDVTLVDTVVDPALGTSDVDVVDAGEFGRLVYVRFDEIPSGASGTINLTVNAPTEAPATLYNEVFLRSEGNLYGHVNLSTALVGAAQPSDLSITKVASNGTAIIQEVTPGQTFYYIVTVTNPLGTAAPDVIVTDKLPYDVTLVDTVVDPALGISDVDVSGDQVYVRFDEIPSGASGTINLTVNAPTKTPTTLYNIVNLRYNDDPDTSNNRMTLATYVPQIGYNQTEAAKSFEDLLHNQSQLLFQFEDLLHTIPNNDSMNYTFLVSFEQLLRSQADLTSSFEDLLTNESSTGWDTEYTEENRTELLWSYEQMLYDEAFLFASFNMKINDSWMSLCDFSADDHTQDAQTELIASFEDLLKRQTRLYKSFNLLLKKIDITSHQDLIDFLAAYENLLRVEANLLMSFNELLDMKYENAICTLPCV